MADPDLPLLLLPQATQAAKAKRSGGGPSVIGPGRARQGERLQPRFQRLQETFNEQGAKLQEAVNGAAIEQVVVLEVAGAVEDFYKAVRRSGLQWLIDMDGDDVEPDTDFHTQADPDANLPRKLFLIISDQTAITEILRLWQLYQETGKEAFARGFTPWFHVFERLRDVRLWSIEDRVESDTRSYWEERLAAGDQLVRTEIELWYSDSDQKNVEWANSLRGLLQEAGAEVVHSAEIRAIRYHGFLADLPAPAIRSILEGGQTALAAAGQVMYFRPQLRAMARPGGLEEEPFQQQRPIPTGPPVVAIMDGVPLQNHALLGERIILDDPNDLQSRAAAAYRIHGTSMASIVLHGDLNGQSPTISSKVVIHPILIPDPDAHHVPPDEISEPDRLLVDTIHIGVKRLLEGEDGQPPIAPTVRVINLSIGDLKREFTRSVSPLARLLDWLAWKYRILFVVPTGNLATLDHGLELDVPRANFAALSPLERESAALRAIERDTEYTRLLSPAESLNALTVGGLYTDGSNFTPVAGRFPLFSDVLPCPASRRGPGFLRSVKPDLMAPSGRRLFHERLGNAHQNATLIPVSVASPPGVLSASPSQTPGNLNGSKYSSGTSNAAALVSHAAAHAHSAISTMRDSDIASSMLHARFDSVIMKALAVHTCHWPQSELLNQFLAGVDGNERKRRMSNLFGYGILDIDRLRGCTDHRATLLGVGEIAAEEGWEYRVPLPPALAGKKVWRRVSITLAWLTPINPQHRDYRRALVWFTCDRSHLNVSSAGADHRAMRRGTVQHDVWEGSKASAFAGDAEMTILVSCAADAGELREKVPYALCVSIEVAPGTEVPVYQEIAARVATKIPVAVS